MKNALVLAVLLVAVVACDKEKDPTRSIFTFTLKDDFYAQYNAETWIVIRDDDNGELIDSRQIVDKNPVVFESDKPISSNKLAITLLRVYTAGENKNNYAQVYNGIDVGSTWIVAQRSTSNQITIKATGTFQFKIEDVPGLQGFSISDKFGDFSYNLDYINNTVVGGFSIHEGAPRQLMVVNIGDKPKYLWLEDLVGGEQVNLTYSDFKEFDKYVKVDVPDDEYSGFSINTTGDAYVLHRGTIFNTPPLNDVLHLGYLNEFSDYETFVYSSDWDHFERGPAPTSVQYLDGNDFHTSGNTIKDYTISTTSDYQYSSIIFSRFEQSTNTSSQVLYWNQAGTTKLHEPLTDELVAKYSIPLDDLRSVLTTFSLGEDDIYENQIRYLFDPTYQLVVTKSVHVMK